MSNLTAEVAAEQEAKMAAALYRFGPWTPVKRCPWCSNVTYMWGVNAGNLDTDHADIMAALEIAYKSHLAGHQ